MNSPKLPNLSPSIEILVDPKTGEVRQAGSDQAGQLVKDFKALAERDLYTFAKYVIGYNLLTPTLHKPFCDSLTTIPPNRHLSLMPRGHFKSTVMKAMAMHMLIQPDGRNIYFPKGIGGVGHSEGLSTRIFFTSKTAQLAKDALVEIMQIFETNKLLRAFWPHCVWEDLKDARYWNSERIILPRKDIFREGSIETAGIGGQTAGYHFNVLMHDDLIDEKAANSPTIMMEAIAWFRISRALMDDPENSLEYVTGTRWAVGDLYEYIMTEDHTVEPYIRRVIENDRPIFPERYTPEVIEDTRRMFGTMFPLLMMNEAADPDLVDFDMTKVRYFKIDGQTLEFDESEWDIAIHEKRGIISTLDQRRAKNPSQFGKEPTLYDALASRNEYLRNVRTS